LASDFHKTEDHFFEASEIDRNRRDPLLFQLASALSQAGQLLQRDGGSGGGAELLPQPLAMLGELDNSLCYCAMALERNPTNKRLFVLWRAECLSLRGVKYTAMQGKIKYNYFVLVLIYSI
jgi:hypothetical protein